MRQIYLRYTTLSNETRVGFTSGNGRDGCSFGYFHLINTLSFVSNVTSTTLTLKLEQKEH